MADRIKKLKREDKRIPKNKSMPTDGPRRLSVGIVGIRKVRKSSVISDGSSSARARNPFSDLVPTASRSSVSVLTKVNNQTGETTHLRRKSKVGPIMRSSRKDASAARSAQVAQQNALLLKSQGQLGRIEKSPTATLEKADAVPIAMMRPSKQKLEKLRTASPEKEIIAPKPLETAPVVISKPTQRRSLEDGFVTADSSKAMEDMAMDKIDRFLESLNEPSAPNTPVSKPATVTGSPAGLSSSIELDKAESDTVAQDSVSKEPDERALSHSSWSTAIEDRQDAVSTSNLSDVNSISSHATSVRPLSVSKTISNQDSIQTKVPPIAAGSRETFKGVDAAWLTEMYNEYISQQTAVATHAAETPAITSPALRPLILPAVIGELEKGAHAERPAISGTIARTSPPRISPKSESPVRLTFGSSRSRSSSSLSAVALSPRSELPNPLGPITKDTAQPKPPPINLASRPVMNRTNTALSQQEAVQIAKAKLELASGPFSPVKTYNSSTSTITPTTTETFRPEKDSVDTFSTSASTANLPPRTKPKLKSNPIQKTTPILKESTMPQFTGPSQIESYDLSHKSSASIEKRSTDDKTPTRSVGKAASVRSSTDGRGEDRKPIVSNNVSFFDPFCGDAQLATPSAYIPSGDDTISPSDAKSIGEIRAASIIALARKQPQESTNTKRSSKLVVETAQTKRANTTPLLAALEFLDGRSDDEANEARPVDRMTREPSHDPFDTTDEALLAYPVPPRFKQTAKQQEMLGMEPANDHTKLTKSITRASKGGSLSSDDELLPKLRKRSSGFGVSMKASKLLGMSANVKKFAASQKAKLRDANADSTQAETQLQQPQTSHKTSSTTNKSSTQPPNHLDLEKADAYEVGTFKATPSIKSSKSLKSAQLIASSQPEPLSPTSPTSLRPSMRASASYSRSTKLPKPLLEPLSEADILTAVTMEEVLGLKVVKPRPESERYATLETEASKGGFVPQPEKFGVSGHFSIAQREASISKARVKAPGPSDKVVDSKMSSDAASADHTVSRPALNKASSRTSFTGYDMRQAPKEVVSDRHIDPVVTNAAPLRSPNLPAGSYARRASSVYSANRYASQTRSVASSNSPEFETPATFQTDGRLSKPRKIGTTSGPLEVEAALAKDTGAKLPKTAIDDSRGRQNFNLEMLGSPKSSVRSRSRSTSPGTTSLADGTETSASAGRATSVEPTPATPLDSLLHDPDVTKRARPSNKRLTTLDRINQTATSPRNRSPATSVKSAASIEQTKHIRSSSAHSSSGSVPISYYAPKNKANIDPFRNLGLPVIPAGKVISLDPVRHNEEPGVVRSYTRSARGSITSVSSRTSNEAQYQAKATDGSRDIMAPRTAPTTAQATSSARVVGTQHSGRPVSALTPRTTAEVVPKKSRPASVRSKASETFDIRRALAKSEDGAASDEETDEDLSPFYRPRKQDTTAESEEASLGALASTATQALSKWFG